MKMRKEMADEKKINGELSDEELNEAAGGVTIPVASGAKACATPGCPNTIPANSTEQYCDSCLSKRSKKFKKGITR